MPLCPLLVCTFGQTYTIVLRIWMIVTSLLEGKVMEITESLSFSPSKEKDA